MDSTAAPSSFNLECPISIKWIISEEKLADLKDSINGFLKTKNFSASTIPGVKYHFKIYPYKPISNDVWITMNLEIGNETKIKADLKYTIESAGYTHEVSHEYNESYGWGLGICYTADFFDPENKFIVDGKVTVKCEGILSVEPQVIVVEEEIKLDAGALGPKLWLDDDKDITIKVGEDSIKAHKNVLAAQSPLFKAIFGSGMKESNNNQMEITDFSFYVVKTAIQLLYNFENPDHLNLKDKMELLQFCDKYDIGHLKTCFEASLIREVSSSTVCHLTNCSIIANAVELQEECAEFLTECITSRTPVIDIGHLDKDFLLNVVTNACCTITET